MPTRKQTVPQKPQSPAAKKPTPLKKPAEPKPEAILPRPQSTQESLPDETLLCHLVIPQRPATKKTHQRIVRRGGFNRILPSLQYEEYESHCETFCRAAWQSKGETPMDFGVSIALRAFMPNWAGMPDHCGILQSLGDIIEKYGVVANDKFIQWVGADEHWFSIDKENPRVELWIYRCRHPYETFRAEQENEELRKRARAAAKNAKTKGTN